MKESTYSVFVRFRRGQRLTLKRSVPLDVALRFACQVRSERFHNPDDVFVADDASGEIVTESSLTADGVVKTMPEAPLSSVQSSQPGDKSDLEALLKYVGRWQLRHTELTIRGGQRLISGVERSLRQFLRLMDFLRPMKLPDGAVERVVGDALQVIEQVQKVRESLQELETEVTALRRHERVVPNEPPVAVDAEVLSIALAGLKKRPGRDKN